MDPQEISELLRMYLFDRHSCFNAALRDARKATGRRQNNGTKKPSKDYGNWLGAIGYMALLDQIGGSLRPTGKKTNYTNEIKKALDYFDSGLNDEEINALYALRCSFAHNYSLINFDPNFKGKNKSKDKLAHRFHVRKGGNKVVELPSKKWNRDFTNKSSNNITYIDLEAFGDLVEKIRSILIEKYERNELQLSVPPQEFKEKYFFHTLRNP